MSAHVRRNRNDCLRVYFLRTARGGGRPGRWSHRPHAAQGVLQSHMWTQRSKREALEKGYGKPAKSAQERCTAMPTRFASTYLQHHSLYGRWCCPGSGNKMYEGIRINHIERVQHIGPGQ